jgi:hypothetical protein
MELRNYKIEILPRNGYALPAHIPALLSCSDSEPSAFNASNPKGLTFTKENGSSLDNNPVFRLLVSFADQLPGAPEITQVDGQVWAVLTEAGIARSDVNVRVTYLNNHTI